LFVHTRFLVASFDGATEMDALFAELTYSSHLAFPVIATRMLLAALFGAVIGFEREWRNRPAGLRTHVLICIAAATFGILTIEIVHAPPFQGAVSSDQVKVDPIRVIEAITAGVAFLAAGTIVLARGEVHGLTTGAGMWLAGATGLACGLGYWKIALFATFLTIVVLTVLYAFEQKSGLNDDAKSIPYDPNERSSDSKS
jgi:putative Mg2+ transporter-C (MgtC) family protein